jgi:[ribosomal protein S18]-alanine N-acetyltransferase
MVNNRLLFWSVASLPMTASKSRRKGSRIRVRRARRGDLDALVELEHRVFATDRMSRPGLRRLLLTPSARVIVAEVRGRVAGAAVVLFRARASVARLYSIAVLPQMCGKGAAVALLAAAERVALRRRCRAMRLEVHVFNTAAISRYRKSGYRQFGRYRSYYENGGDALRFEKTLGVRRARAAS